MADTRTGLDPDAGPTQAFAHQLRLLRERAGNPDYRSMARRVGCAPSTLSTAAAGKKLPTLETTLAFVRACGGDHAMQEDMVARWKRVSVELAQATPRPVAGPDPRLPAPRGTAAETDYQPATARPPRRYWVHIAATAIVSAALGAVGVLILVGAGQRAASQVPSDPAPASAAAAGSAQTYDVYGCVGADVPPTVTLSPAGNPRSGGWRSSRPVPWVAPQCQNQIWWAPYLNGGANPAVTFNWTFATSTVGTSTCMVWAYYPPPPSAHAAGTAHYLIQDGTSGSATRLAYVPTALGRLKGSWYQLGVFAVTSGHLRITLDNLGSDPDPEHGVIAGPIHVSCR